MESGEGWKGGVSGDSVARTLIVSQVEMQFEMYRCTNSVGRSTAVVSRLTTSIECSDMSMFTSTEKYSLI